jgi:hypothetical protein
MPSNYAKKEHEPTSNSRSFSAHLAQRIDSFFTSSWLPSIFAISTRTGTLQCQCGSIQYDLRVPSSSLLIEQTNAICHCQDCVGFCHALSNSNTLQNHGPFMVNFYKSDLVLKRGREQIRAVQLYPDSPLVRTYCGNCHTPLGADVTIAPICLVYEALIHDSYSVRFLPSIVLGYKDAVAGKTKPYARSVTVKWKNYGPIFLLKSLGRMLLGWLLGKSHGGFLENDYGREYPIGLESLTAASTAIKEKVR